MANEENPKGNVESNPLGSKLNINVSIPRLIKVDLVEASSLSDLEIWIFIASTMSNFVVGFAVAWAQAEDGSELLGIYRLITLIFVVFLVLSGIMVFLKFKKLSKEKTSFNMEVKSAGPHP